MSSGEWIGLAVVVGGLAVTNPSVEHIEAELRQKILVDIQNTQLNPNADFAQNFLTGVCKFSTEECYRIVRATISIKSDDYFIGKVVNLSQGNRRLARCLGVVQRLWCPGFLQK